MSRAWAFGVIAGLFAGLACLSPVRAGSPPPPPPPSAEAFARLPEVQKAVISPSGDKIAILGGTASRRMLSIVPVDGTRVVTLGLQDVESTDLRWGGDSFVILSTLHLESGADAKNGGRFAYHFARDVVITDKGEVAGRLLSDSDASKYMTALPVLRVVEGQTPAAIVQGADWGAAAFTDPSLSRLKDRDEGLNAALWKVDIGTGVGRLQERGGPDTRGWAVDAQGQGRVRFDTSVNPDGFRILARAKGDGGYKTLVQGSYDGATTRYLGYSDPEDAVYLAELNEAGTYRVIRRSLEDGAVSTVMDATAAPSVSMAWDPYTSAPLAVISTGEKTSYHWLDTGFASLHAKLQRAFPGRNVDLLSWSRDRSRVILHVSSADAPGTWHMLDVAKGAISPIGADYPQLAGAALGTTSWFTYKAADGLVIPAYLTLPPGRSAAVGGLPLVVLPHGGPAARDTDDFDWWTQFLASRGYAVLRPEFRGSSGFGEAFQRAGEHEWGGKMQTDLLDGIGYLAARGVIDPKRVCIAGWSFGGYAALAGITLHPDAYRCAVSVNGVSDLPVMVGEELQAWGGDSGDVAYWRRAAGDPRTAEAMMRDASPSRHAAQAGGPVLLVAGEQDTTVPFKQSQLMKHALDEAGKPAELVVIHDDDHSLARPDSRARMLAAMEAFLAANLPVGPGR